MSAVGDLYFIFITSLFLDTDLKSGEGRKWLEVAAVRSLG
jgi:hypothetical protein